MSNANFPTLVGVDSSVFKTPIWSTDVKKTASGREMRASFYSYPIYKFSLKFNVLRADAAQLEFQTLIGFFNARQGQYDSFLYTDPTDSVVTAQHTGTGNGTATVFPLFRTMGGYLEPIMYTDSMAVYINGVVQVGGYTIANDPAIVTFATPPGPGLAITITGTFKYRCRFLQDETEFEQFMYNLWNAKKVEFTSLKP